MLNNQNVASAIAAGSRPEQVQDIAVAAGKSLSPVTLAGIEESLMPWAGVAGGAQAPDEGDALGTTNGIRRRPHGIGQAGAFAESLTLSSFSDQTILAMTILRNPTSRFASA